MTPSSDLDQLSRLLRLPVPPTRVTFEKVVLGQPGGLGPTDWELIAVLEYEPAALKSLTAPPAGAPSTGQMAQDAPLFANDELRPWFPPEVKAAFRPDGKSDQRCRGAGFDAAPFARSPLLQGNFVVPEGTNFVVLRMQTS